MEEKYIEDGVRTRLILAGIGELEERGIRNFALRRAALSAQVSCAAPYRHFRDKEEFISEIISYIGSRWLLLAREICAAFKGDARRTVIELAVASLRFWLANPNFRTVLMAVSPTVAGVHALSDFDAPILCAIEEYCAERGCTEIADVKKYAVRTLIYGSVMLVGFEGTNTETVELLRKKLESEFR